MVVPKTEVSSRALPLRDLPGQPQTRLLGVVRPEGLRREGVGFGPMRPALNARPPSGDGQECPSYGGKRICRSFDGLTVDSGIPVCC